MNAYCKNNPINCVDPFGNMSSRDIQIDLAFNRNSGYTIEDAILAAKKENSSQFAGYNYNVGNYNTDYYGPAWSHIQIFHGYGYSITSGSSGSIFNVYANYYNDSIIDSTVGFTLNIGAVATDFNIGLSDIRLSVGTNVNDASNYLSFGFSPKDLKATISWDSSVSYDGYLTYYDDNGVSLNLVPLAVCALATLAILTGTPVFA